MSTVKTVVLTWVAATGLCLAQNSGNIRETVTDPASANVPGADVSATNIQTGLTQSTKSSNDGVYSIPFLPVGNFMKQVDDEKDIRIVAVSDIYTVRKERARGIAQLTDKDVHHEYQRPFAQAAQRACGIGISNDHSHQIGRVCLSRRQNENFRPEHAKHDREGTPASFL